MKSFVVLCLVALAVAAPPPDRGNPRFNPAAPYGNSQILRYDFDNIGVGGYSFGYETSDGTRHDAKGTLRNEGQDDESLAVQGSYQWVGPDGVTYVVKYIADENGFQPEIEQGPGGGVPPGVVASLLG